MVVWPLFLLCLLLLRLNRCLLEDGAVRCGAIEAFATLQGERPCVYTWNRDIQFVVWLSCLPVVD